MNILVTGSSGYIGGSICISAKIKNYHVTGIDMVARDHLQPYMNNFIQVDIEDDYVAYYLQQNKPDVIVHCAGLISVEKSISNPAKYLDYNVSKTIKFLGLVNKYVPQAHVIFSSTGSIYKPGLYLKETDEINPTNPYSFSKWIAEQVISQFNFKYTIFRYFNACGSLGYTHGQLPRSPHIFAKLFESEAFTLNGINYSTPDGTCIRDYIHIRDLVDAHFFVMDKKLIGTYNIGRSKGYSNMQLYQEFVKQVKFKPLIYGDPRSGDLPVTVSDTEKINQQGWHCKYKLEDMFQDLLLWYHSNNYKRLVDGKVYFD